MKYQFPFSQFGAGGAATLQTQTATWKAGVLAAGGTMGGSSLSIADALVVQMKTRSYFSKLTYMLPFLGVGIDAARMPLIDVRGVGIATNHSMVTGDFTEATGLQGNGSNKWLDTLIKPSQIGSSNNGGIGYWARSVASGVWCCGWHDVPNGEIYGLALYSDELFYFGNSASATRTLAAASAGHYYGQKAGGTDRKLYKAASQLVSNTNSPAVVGIAGGTILLMALDSGNLTNGQCSCFYTTDGTLTGTEMTNLHADVGTYLITATGR